MTPSKLLLATLALSVPLSSLGCDGEPNTFTEATFPLCEAQTTRLVGTIDGAPLDVTLPAAGGGTSQDSAGGEFQYQGNFTSDPALADLRLTWESSTGVGDVVDARGTLRLVEGALAGKTFCARAGTKIRMPGDETIIQFELAGLGSGDGCAIEHAGTIRGCAR